MKWYLYALMFLIVVHSTFGLTDDFQVLAPHEITLCACDQLSTELTIANIGDVASTYAARPDAFSSPFVSVMPETFALGAGESGNLYQVFSASCSERNTLRTLTTYFQSSHGVNKVLLQNLTIQACNSIKLLSYTDEQIVCMEDTATYHFTITNVAPYTETYYLNATGNSNSESSLDIEKYVQLGLSEIAVAPGDTRDVYVYVRPYDLAGMYSFGIDVAAKNSGYASSLTFDLTSGYCNGVPQEEADSKKPFLDEENFTLIFVLLIIILIILIAVLFCIFLYQKRDVLRERYEAYQEERARKATEKDEASETLALADEETNGDKKEVPVESTPVEDVEDKEPSSKGPTFIERIKLWWASLFAHDEKEELASPDAPWMEFPAKDLDESIESTEGSKDDVSKKKESSATTVETPLMSSTDDESEKDVSSLSASQSKWPIILIIIIALLIMLAYYFWGSLVGFVSGLGVYLYYIIAAIILLLLFWYFSRGKKGDKNVVDLRDPNKVKSDDDDAKEKEISSLQEESSLVDEEKEQSSQSSSFFGVDKTPLTKEDQYGEKSSKSFFTWKVWSILSALLLIVLVIVLAYLVIPALLPYVWYIVVGIIVLFLLLLFSGKKEEGGKDEGSESEIVHDAEQQTLDDAKADTSAQEEKKISPFFVITGIVILILFLLILGFAFLYAPLTGDSATNETANAGLDDSDGSPDVEDVDSVDADTNEVENGESPEDHTIPDDLPKAVFEDSESDEIPVEDEIEEIEDDSEDIVDEEIDDEGDELDDSDAEDDVENNVEDTPSEDTLVSDDAETTEIVEEEAQLAETIEPQDPVLYEVESLLSYIEKEGLTESFLYQVVPEGSSIELDLGKNFVDPDGDELFFTHTDTEHVTIDIWKNSATLTPIPSFVGIEKVTFYAEDASGYQIESGVVTIIVPPAEESSSLIQTLFSYKWYILLAIIVLIVLLIVLSRKKESSEDEETPTLTDYGFSEKEKIVIEKDEPSQKDFDFDEYLEELEKKKK